MSACCSTSLIIAGFSRCLIKLKKENEEKKEDCFINQFTDATHAYRALVCGGPEACLDTALLHHHSNDRAARQVKVVLLIIARARALHTNSN